MRNSRNCQRQHCSPAQRQLLAQLQRLDIVPCNCALEVVTDDDGNRHFLPCPHTLKTPDHGISLEKWAQALLALAPDEYADPPTAARPTRATQQHALIEVYRQRVANGEAVFHAGDVRVEQLERLGRQGSDRARNGSDYAAGCTVEGGDE